MLIGGDDISNDVITLGTCFSMFVYIILRSFLLHADCPKSDSSVDGEPQGNRRWNSNSRDVVSSSPCFSHPATRAPRRAYSQAMLHLLVSFLLCCYSVVPTPSLSSFLSCSSYPTLYSLSESHLTCCSFFSHSIIS